MWLTINKSFYENIRIKTTINTSIITKALLLDTSRLLASVMIVVIDLVFFHPIWVVLSLVLVFELGFVHFLRYNLADLALVVFVRMKTFGQRFFQLRDLLGVDLVGEDNVVLDVEVAVVVVALVNGHALATHLAHLAGLDDVALLALHEQCAAADVFDGDFKARQRVDERQVHLYEQIVAVASDGHVSVKVSCAQRRETYLNFSCSFSLTTKIRSPGTVPGASSDSP